jgi:hypothetical protein
MTFKSPKIPDGGPMNFFGQLLDLAKAKSVVPILGSWQSFCASEIPGCVAVASQFHFGGQCHLSPRLHVTSSQTSHDRLNSALR